MDLAKNFGIELFTTNLDGFQGVFRETNDDFIVKELEENGQPTSLIKLIDINDYIEKPMTEEQKNISKYMLIKLITEDIYSSLIEYTESFNKEYPNDSFVIPISFSKEDRTTIHQCIKILFPLFVSTTNDKGHIILYSNKNAFLSKRESTSRWKDKNNKYLEFTLEKNGYDIFSLMSLLSSKLHRKSNIFSYKGIKDKNAITYQKIRAYKVTPNEIYQVTKDLPRVRIGDLTFKSSPFYISQSCGNHFTITIRRISKILPIGFISVLTSSLLTYGFYNYFGLQRFGNKDVHTSSVSLGIQFLKNDNKGIVESLFSEQNHPQLLHSYNIYKLGGPMNESLNVIPSSFKDEYKLMQVLYKTNNYSTAVASIPLTKRIFYIHSYQSFLFNKLLTYRIQNYGQKPIYKDLVWDIKSSLTNQSNSHTPSVISLDSTNIHNFQLKDVVLPLPGTQTIIPSPLIQYYESLLMSDKLTTSCWNHKVKEYLMLGTYRSIIEIPKDLTINQLENDIKEITNQKETNIQIKFSLNSGSYATMLMREIMKKTME